LPVPPAPSIACPLHLPVTYVPVQLLLSSWLLRLQPFSWLLQLYAFRQLYVFLRQLYVQLLSFHLPYALPRCYSLLQPPYVLLRLFAVALTCVFLQRLCFQPRYALLLSWLRQLNYWLFVCPATAGLTFFLSPLILEPDDSAWSVRLHPVLADYYPNFAVPGDVNSGQHVLLPL